MNIAILKRSFRRRTPKISYFCHPDHLGSTSYVTDASGEVYQHLEYFAFGETFVEEHSNTDRTPYLFNGKELDEETGLYYYGARYYDARASVWLAVDPKAEKYSGISAYAYTLNNPIIYTDPDGKDAILIVFPNFKIDPEIKVGKWKAPKVGGLGHAGVLLINNKTGRTKYYEYGRYPTEDGTKGRVRNIKISDVEIGADGKPTPESLNKVMEEISTLSGQGGKIEGAYVVSDKFKEMNDYAQQKLKESNPGNKDYNKDRSPYELDSNNCGTFAEDVINQDQSVDKPSIWNPSPTNIVNEYQEEGNARVQYDPKTKKTTIGTGNESDAKIKSND